MKEITADDLTDDTVVYLTSAGRGDAGRNRVHVDKSCTAAKRAKSLWPKTARVVDLDLLCTRCTNQYDPSEHNNDPTKYHDLIERIRDSDAEGSE